MTPKALLTCVTIFSILWVAASPNLHVSAHAQMAEVALDFPTIQAAINNATDGDMILVHKGTYNENIVVNKTIALVGEDMTGTIIDGNGSGIPIRISAKSVTVENFTVQGGGSNASEAGVLVESSSCNVTDNIIRGNGLVGVCLNLSSNVVLSGNVVAQNGGDGIVLLNSSNNTLIGNDILENKFGVHMYSSNQNNISNNRLAENILGGINLFYSSSNRLMFNHLTGNNGSGIILDFSSDNNTLSENTVGTTKGFGLEIISSSYNVLKSNSLAENTYDFYCPGTRSNLLDFINDIDTSNTVNGRPIYYFVSEKGLLIDQPTFTDIGYLALVNCTNMTVQEIAFSQNGQGLLLAFTNNTVVKHVRAAGNNHGIQLVTSINNTITDNTLSNNKEDGLTLDYLSNKNTVAHNIIENNTNGIRMIHETSKNCIVDNMVASNAIGLWSYSLNDQNIIRNNVFANNTQGISMFRQCNNNTITQNTIANNTGGLYLGFCSQNLIFNNNFINNTVHVTNENSTSAWDDGYPSGGNFWSNYTDVDSDNDGIGDQAYVVDSTNMDEYPLMGVLYDFDVTAEDDEVYNVQVVSNSTVSDLTLLGWLSSPNQYMQLGQRYIHFSVSGENGTVGFCRTLIPRNMLNGTYTVLVDWHEVQATEFAASNSTHAYLYFTYQHSVHEVIIVTEFPPTIVALLFVTITLTFVAHRRKRFIGLQELILKRTRTEGIACATQLL